MKNLPLYAALLFLVALPASCKKEIPFERGNNNKPAVTNAGTDPESVLNSSEFSHWTQLQHAPADEFFFAPRYWFDGSNFLMGISDQLFAVSNKGNVWKYNAGWIKTGVFPEQITTLPVVFAVGGKGYCIGNGHCWQYNPLNNQWTRKKDPPVAVALPLVINNIVYLRGANNRIIAYNHSTDSYVQKSVLPDFGGYISESFVLNAEGYYTGANRQTWKYNPVTNRWQRKADLVTPGTFYNTSSFSLNNYGYIIGDLNGDAYNNNSTMKIWRYDPALNQWKQFYEDYPGYGAYLLSTVSFNGVAYVGLGYNNGDFNAIDVWSFR